MKLVGTVDGVGSRDQSQWEELMPRLLKMLSTIKPAGAVEERLPTEPIRGLLRLLGQLSLNDSHYVLARNGKAGVLKALGRLDEALEAYDATLREFPQDVVVRNGKAEVLKALGRLDEALGAYGATVREFATFGTDSGDLHLQRELHPHTALPIGSPYKGPSQRETPVKDRKPGAVVPQGLPLAA